VQSSRFASRFPVLQPSPDGHADQALPVGLPFKFDVMEVEHFMSQIALHGVLSSDHRPSACGH